jgi:hypothetical protein
MKPLAVVALVAVILASAAVLFQQGGALLAQFTSWSSPNATVPSQVPFQAVLTQPGGAPVANGSYTIVFLVHDRLGRLTRLDRDTDRSDIGGGLFDPSRSHESHHPRGGHLGGAVAGYQGRLGPGDDPSPTHRQRNLRPRRPGVGQPQESDHPSEPRRVLAVRHHLFRAA